MDRSLKSVNRIVALATQLEEDIRSRRLRPSDRYYSSIEAARYLGVAGDTANRALQLLEKKRIIYRKKKSGAFIAEPEVFRPESVGSIQFLLDRKSIIVEGLGNMEVLYGIQSIFPKASVNYTFPENDAEELERIVKKTLNKEGADAFVLVSVPYETQRIFATSEMPAVIFGTRYPGISGIPSLEQDFADVASKIIQLQEQQNRKKSVLLMRQYVRGGDATLFDELYARCRGQMKPFFLADDPESGREVLEKAFPDSLPDFVVSISSLFSQVIDRIRRDRHIPAKDMQIVTIHPDIREQTKTPGLCFVDAYSPLQLGTMLGNMLLRRLGGLSQEDVLVPMTLT
ncbi:MAG: hypothetical protein Q4G68_00455 [Planctomycetia bacterium]|nr:hypothetical protein [Planctomycetia bacterium]